MLANPDPGEDDGKSPDADGVLPDDDEAPRKVKGKR